FARVINTFENLGLRAEQARALWCKGRASLLEGKMREAREALRLARELYAAEGNATGEAAVTLSEAEIHQAEGNLDEAAAAASLAEGPLADAGRWDLSLLARWLRAEAARATGDDGVAAELLNSTLAEAGSRSLPQLEARCHASLGMLFARSGNAGRAEASLKH